HRRVAPTAARRRVRRSGEGSRLPRVDLADHEARRHTRADHVHPRRERPARPDRGDRADRRGAAGEGSRRRVPPLRGRGAFAREGEEPRGRVSEGARVLPAPHGPVARPLRRRSPRRTGRRRVDVERLREFGVERARSRVPARYGTLVCMREEAVRVAGRLEATLRIPDVEPRAVVVVAHPLPTHGGTMRNPLVASLARAIAARGFYALRFNFRGVGASDGEWTGGVEEWRDVADAVAHARDTFPELPVGVAARSFGALTTLRWIEKGGHANGIALVGVPLRSVWLAPQELPAVPDGTFIVAAAHDQFGTAEELRRALPRARIAEVKGVDHFFVGKRDEAGRLVAGELARALASTVP